MLARAIAGNASQALGWGQCQASPSAGQGRQPAKSQARGNSLFPSRSRNDEIVSGKFS